jgi:multiple sugar transport system substrate-binding protein
MRGYERTHPDVTVRAVPGQNDTSKDLLAITSGQGPDLITAFGTDNLGQLCGGGQFLDLSRYERRDHIAADQFIPAAQTVLSWHGKQCALPLLTDTYGLYYNKSLLRSAGYTQPPQTTDQLAQMAVKLTQYNSDGSIKVAGFDPLFGFLENWTTNYVPWFGASYFDSAGKADLATDPHWTALFEFQKKIIDAIGYDKLKRFGAKAGDEFSSDNPFETGKVAMELDGEWRTAFIQREHASLDYGTAPVPAPGGDTSLFGASNLGLGVIGIPKGTTHADAAWELLKYLAATATPQAQFASAIHNVPTLLSALKSPNLNLGTHFAPFLMSADNPRSNFPTILAGGPVYYDPISTLTQKWQAGEISDLAAALRDTDNKIDALVGQR